MNQTTETNENLKKMGQWVTIGMRIAADPSIIEKLAGDNLNMLELLQSQKHSNGNSSRKKRHHKSSYAVQDEELLYKLADAGLLCKLHGVNSKAEPHIYYFDEDFDVKTIVDDFKKSGDKANDDNDGIYTGVIKTEGGLGIIPN